MVYDHNVIHDGVFYPTGAEVPEDDYELPFTDETEPEDTVTYTKTQINRMSTAELQKLAADIGLDGAGEKNGGELKKELIAFFNL